MTSTLKPLAANLFRAIVAFSLAIALIGCTTSRAADAAAIGCPKAPAFSNLSAWYTYVNVYNGACASHTNWGRSMPDQTITTKVDGTSSLSVTTSTALAGAIASIKLNGHEFIASGGHGAAAQWYSVPEVGSNGESECYNPTQAGAKTDDQEPAAPPYHGASSSALFINSRTTTSIHTESRLAYYVPRDSSSSFNGCSANDYQRDDAASRLHLSNWWVSQDIAFKPFGLENVIKVDATLSTTDSAQYAKTKVFFIMFLLNTFTVRAGTVYNGVGSAYDPTTWEARCDVSGYCIGSWSPRQPQWSTQQHWGLCSNDAYYGPGGTCWSWNDFALVGGAPTMHATTYIILGTPQRIADTVAALQAAAN